VQVLNEAKALDPENSVAREYLDKLVLNTSKFKTITEQYYPLVNPAYLGIIRFDSMYVTASYNTLFAPEWRDISVYPGLQMREWDTRIAAGYNMPIGDNFGLGINYMFYSTSDQLTRSCATNGFLRKIRERCYSLVRLGSGAGLFYRAERVAVRAGN
jgi:hypothetical protein